MPDKLPSNFNSIFGIIAGNMSFFQPMTAGAARPGTSRVIVSSF
jgi:hypothetical protein